MLDESMTYEYIDTTNTQLGATEQLYTARGSQGIGIWKGLAQKMGVDPSDYTDLYLTSFFGGGDNSFYF